MDYAIEVRGLCKHYPKFSLDHVDLLLPPGTVMGLIGANGAGKSTLIRCLLGVTKPNDGILRLLGEEHPATNSNLRQRIGMVLDGPTFHDALNAKDVGKIHAGLYRTWEAQAFANYIEKFQLPPQQKIKEYSKGMKMKLAIATALSHRPEVLILDEATVGLDPVVRREVLDELFAFVSDGQRSVLLSSHITSDLEHVADYITYLHKGKILFSDEKDRLLERYGRLVCSAQDLSTVDRSHLSGVLESRFHTEALVNNRQEFLKKYPHLTVDPVSLEDIMVFLEKGQ